MKSLHAPADRRQMPDSGRLPSGIWLSDPDRSTVGFSVAHRVVDTFSARFGQVEACLAVDAAGAAALSGTARAASAAVADPALAVRLASADFFDAARHPLLRFESTTVRRAGEHLELDGRLTIRGRTLAVAVLGTVRLAEEDDHGAGRVRLELETRLDRRQFGLRWNGPLAGGTWTLGNEVHIEADLTFIPVHPSGPLAG